MVDDADVQQAIQSSSYDPLPARQVALHTAYQVNIAARRSPYAGIVIQTRAELLWIMRQHDWSGNRLAEGKRRANLSHAILRKLDLSEIYLYEADLSHSRLEGVNLTNAHLGGANLIGADLVGANLNHVDLAFAKLNGARLYRANLSFARLGEASLVNANLSETMMNGVDLRRADLRGANLKEARMDAGTKIEEVKFDSKTYLGDVVWNGVSLVRVDWAKVPRLGDEYGITSSRTREEAIKACRAAARAYRGLAIVLGDQGLGIPASEYHLREQRLERKAAFLERKLLSALFSLLLDLISGYGERPGRAFIAYLLVNFGFAVIYYFISQNLKTQHISYLSALVYSVTSFHGRGFFPGYILNDPDNPLIQVSAVEAVIGLFIEITFIATFTRRFLGS